MPVVCKYCDKSFSRQFTLNRHNKEVHGELLSYDKEVWGFKCLQPSCNNSFQRGEFLIEHLEKVHHLKFEYETIVFANMDEFTSWKQSMEEESSAYYVVCKGHTYKDDRTISYFNCNRSKTGHNGNRKVDEQYKRNCKSQGLYHMNSSCTSQMKVVCDNNKKVTVNFQRKHYGHETELAKIRLPKHERANISAKLINGVPPKKIVQTLCDNIGEHLKRIDLLTMADVNNIKKSFGIDVHDGRRHENDAVSLNLWVQECMSKTPDENPIVYYKRQGTEAEVLKQEDFCLIIMNRFQKIMLQKFGGNTLTIDGTHGLNCYDFELTTLMVLDEFRQGFPTAFMFTNRKDVVIYQLFFQHIKAQIGEIEPKIFMSDLAAAYFNAWILVMNSSATQHLYCAWHVDRAWQSNITKVKGPEKQKEVKKAIKILQQNTTEEEFELCLNNTITLLLNDEDTHDFGIYFKNNYVSNCKKWAYCFRKDSLINTNMHIEAMHQILKYIYADRKTIRRIDKGVNLVLQFLRDKCRDRIVKLVKGKSTNRTKEIFKRHCEAQQLNNYTLDVRDNIWKVTKDTGQTYLIKQKQHLNCCLDICSACNICRHKYTCTCLDSSGQKSVCKHIHYVMLHLQRKQLITQSKNCAGTDLELFSAAFDKSKETPEEKLNKKINNVFSKLQNFDYSSLDDSTIETIHHHLNIVQNLTHLPQNRSLQENNFVIKAETNKKYVEPQPRFFSTKRKQPSSSSTTVKLSDIERSETKKMMHNKCALVISSNSAEDHSY